MCDSGAQVRICVVLCCVAAGKQDGDSFFFHFKLAVFAVRCPHAPLGSARRAAFDLELST